VTSAYLIFLPLALAVFWLLCAVLLRGSDFFAARALLVVFAFYAFSAIPAAVRVDACGQEINSTTVTGSVTSYTYVELCDDQALDFTDTITKLVYNPRKVLLYTAVLYLILALYSNWPAIVGWFQSWWRP